MMSQKGVRNVEQVISQKFTYLRFENWLSKQEKGMKASNERYVKYGWVNSGMENAIRRGDERTR